MPDRDQSDHRERDNGEPADGKTAHDQSADAAGDLDERDETGHGEQFHEVASRTPVRVPETHRLYRLTPHVNDLARGPRRIAVVAAETEAQARALAQACDPFGCDWISETGFACESLDDDAPHVIGDVVFKSVPAPASNGGARHTQPDKKDPDGRRQRKHPAERT